ncbi:hypothetical protein Z945_2455 [Sulfitobacter noctilucae]|uniref:hypothetical protein n=1 Tax=Sulfitobacter noctilucae TaxID=1342302 RepID=UPI000469E5E0|nr:hypothetical protein [Sulfitobacter noctilucae]KIN61463.1 hypothetical protein Z945_2455 [Sulfitobacter noctilucae]
MSAPDTNVERQEAKHKPSLFGIKGAVLFGAAMIILMVIFTVMRGETPTEDTVIGNEEQTDGAMNNGAAGVTLDPVEPGTNESN